eukprot:4411712-Pleurochrysis_carterae.AAC.1
MNLVNDDDDQPVPVSVAAPAAAEKEDCYGFAVVTEVDKDVNAAFTSAAASNVTNGKQPAQRATRRAAAASRSTDLAPALAPAAAAPAAAAAINLNKDAPASRTSAGRTTSIRRRNAFRIVLLKPPPTW